MNPPLLIVALGLSLPLTGYSQIINGDFEADRFGDPISGWTGTGQILGQPVGSPLIPPFNTPPPPISISGNCSAGIPSAGTLRQTFVGEQGREYTLSFHAKAMSQPTAGTLRVRALASDGTVLAQLNPGLTTGGAGSSGYNLFTLTVPALASAGPVTLEFANTRSAIQTSTVSIDAVQLTASAPSAPPTLSMVGYVEAPFGSICRLQWTEPAFGFTLQSSPDISGPWTQVHGVQVTRKDGRFAAEVLTNPSVGQVFFRMQAVP